MDQERPTDRSPFKWLMATRVVCVAAIVLQVLQVIRNVYLYNRLDDPYRDYGWYHYHEVFRVGLPVFFTGGNISNLDAGLAKPFRNFLYVYIVYSLGIILLTVLLGMGTLGTEQAQSISSNKSFMVNVWIGVNWTIFVIEVLMDLILTIIIAWAVSKVEEAREKQKERKRDRERSFPTDKELLETVPENFLLIWVFLGLLAIVYRVATLCIVSRFKGELRQRWVSQPMRMNPIMNSYQPMQQYPSQFQSAGLDQVSTAQPLPQWGPNAAYPTNQGYQPFYPQQQQPLPQSLPQENSVPTE